MEGAAHDGHVPWGARKAAETADDYADGGTFVGTSTLRFERRYQMFHRQRIERTVITEPNHTDEDVWDNVV